MISEKESGMRKRMNANSEKRPNAKRKTEIQKGFEKKSLKT